VDRDLPARWPAAAPLLALGAQLARTRSDASARRLFLATLAYLPLLLAFLVLDRVPPRSAAGGGGIASLNAAAPATLE